VSACGSVERLERYIPQGLRPRQAEKPACMVCQEQLGKMIAPRRRFNPFAPLDLIRQMHLTST